MATICLIRIDSRLIHGQVITKWVKQVGANRIVIIDDALSEDPFMSNIYAMAAPPGVKVENLSVDKSLQEWDKNEFGNGRILILFKDVATVYKVFRKGFPMKQIQVGGLGGGPGRRNVYKNIALDKQDFENLREMSKKNVKIVFQMVPEDRPVDFEHIARQFT